MISLFPFLSITLHGPSASEVTTLWHYTNAFITIIVLVLGCCCFFNATSILTSLLADANVICCYSICFIVCVCVTLLTKHFNGMFM